MPAPPRRPKLRAFWGRVAGQKAKDFVFDGPNRQDCRLLHRLLSQEFLDELTRRGYDTTTLKISVERKQPEPEPQPDAEVTP